MIHIVEVHLGQAKLCVLNGPEADLEKLLNDWIVKQIGNYPEIAIDAEHDREVWYSRRRSLRLADFVATLDDKWSEEDYIVVRSKIQ